tara:strand:- start:390 stop:965 length:576 start_codon:yes stop_codon:yes gene_type:complete
MSKEPTDEEFIAGVMEGIKRLPKNKARGDAEEMQAAIIKALQRAYGGGVRDWETYNEEYGEADAGMSPMGDLCMELTGFWTFDNSELMVKIGDAVAAGIQKVIDSNDPDAQEKIRRLSQVAIGAGYIVALLDDKAAGKRRSPVMDDGKKRKTDAERARIQKFAADNPDMTQTAMGKALGVSRQTVGKYLNE